MADNTIRVKLGFEADASAAKKAISDLENSLNNLYKTQKTSGFQDFGINEAVKSARELESCLSRALNQKTGKLDISMFQKSISQAGMSLNDFNTKLLRAGPAGQQVFASLAGAIAQAEVPLKRTSKMVTDFTRSLKNVAQYQISSSMFQAVTGALSDAISYTKDLNSSLNDIRIVTGQSADQMAKFAQQANKSAQLLSTTTNNYAKASLIFYQQGLGSADVKERTDAVIKMANVTKDSMTEVSSYMTSIWNNFDDGTKSLEHYADVMTALGATTASSTAEIAAGLEKFASIGKTIGLSYDYATSALATIVAQTRQSADTVGTGLRTIFSRLQGLSLGKTLEDGVDLNKYSKALSTVGVKILDASGNMKNMDAILESLADKWSNLSQAQKTALAQTVGGVRQYTTLISLMDNWDSMEKNLVTAKNSDGSLQKQQNIYAESWEAAASRSKAAMEGLYDTLLNDKAFIALTDGLTSVTKAVTSLVGAMGGLPGLLSTIGMLSIRVFSKQMGSGINNTVQKFTTWKSQFNGQGFGKAAIQTIRGKSKSAAQVAADEGLYAAQYSNQVQMSRLRHAGKGDSAAYFAAQQASSLLDKKRRMMAANLTEEQAIAAREKLGKISEAQQRRLLLQQEKEAIQKQRKLTDSNDKLGTVFISQDNTYRIGKKKGQTRSDEEQSRHIFQKTGLKNLAAQEFGVTDGDSLTREQRLQYLGKLKTRARKAARDQGLADTYKDVILDGQSSDEDRKSMIARMQKAFGKNVIADTATIDEINNKLEEISQNAQKAETEINDVINAAKGKDAEVGEALEKMVSEARTQGEEDVSLDAETIEEDLNLEGLEESFDKVFGDKGGLGAKISAGLEHGVAAIGGITAGFSQASAAAEVLGDATASIGDKIGSVASMVSGLATAFATGGPLGAVAYGVGVAASFAYDAIDDAYHKEELDAEDAETAASRLQENYQNIQAEYDKMMSTVESYDSAVAALDSLVIGTDAWKESLIAANEAALELINNFDLIQNQDYTIDPNGQISFTQTGQKKIEDKKTEQLNEVIVAQSAASLAQAEAAKMRAEADKDVVVKSNDKGRWATAAGMGVAGAATGAKIGAVGGVKGALAGGLIGGVGGFLGGLLAYDSIMEAQNDAEKAKIDSITETYRKNRNNTELEQLINSEFEGATQSYKDSVMNVVKATIDAETAFADAMELAAKASLNAHATYENIRNEEVKDNVAARATQAYKDAKIKADADYDSTVEADANQAKVYAEEYLKSLSLKGAKLEGDRNSDGSFAYSYLNENNERVKAEMLGAEIKTYTTTKMADAAIDNNVDNWNTVFTELAQGDERDRALATLGAGDLLQATKNERDALSVNDAETLTDEQKRAFGLENKTKGEIRAWIVEAEEAYDKAWEKAEANLNGKFTSALMGNMTAATAQSFSNFINELNKGPMAEAGEMLGSTLSTAFNNLKINDKDQTALLAKISNIDWTQDGAFDSFKQIFEDMGYSLDAAGISWENFEKTMSQATLAVPDFSQLKNTLQSVSSILNKLKLGETVSEDDYTTLTKYNSTWKDFFVLQADGSRKFIGDAKAMKEATLELVEQEKAQLDTRKAIADLVEDQNFVFGTKSEQIQNTAGDFKTLINDPKNSILKTFLSDYGYDDTELNAIIDEAQNGKTERLQKIYQLINESIDPSQLQAANTDYEQMYASLATTTDELDALYNSGKGFSSETYSKSLMAMASSYEYCSTAIKNYQEALKNGADSPEAKAAEEQLKNQIDLEQKAAKVETSLKNSMSDRSKLSMEDLQALKENNTELYNSLLTASEQDWYEISYQAYSEFLQARIDLLDWDTAEYKKAVLEKQQLDEEYYQYQQENIQKQVDNEYEKIEEKYKNLVNSIENATGILDNIDLNIGLDSLGASALEELRQELRAVYGEAVDVNAIIRNIGKQEEGSKEMAIAIADAKMMLQLKKQQAEADKLNNLDGMATVKINAERSTIDPPYTVEKNKLTADTDSADIPIGTSKKPNDLFLKDDGTLKSIDGKEAKYDIVTDGSGMDAGLVKTETGKPPVLYTLTNMSGVYTISEKKGNTWNYIDETGKTMTLKTIASQEGKYLVKEEGTGALYYIDGTGKTPTLKALTSPANTSATTGTYQILFNKDGTAAALVEGDHLVALQPYVNADREEVPGYSIGITANGDTCLVNLEGDTPTLVELGNIEVGVQAGENIVETDKGLRANVDLTPMVQIIKVEYDDQNRRRIQDKLYQYAQNSDARLLGTNNVFSANYNSKGETLSGGFSNLYAAFNTADLYYDSDYLNMLKNSSSGRQYHKMGTQALGGEVIASTHAATDSASEYIAVLTSGIMTRKDKHYSDETESSRLDDLRAFWQLQDIYQEGIQNGTIDKEWTEWLHGIKNKEITIENGADSYAFLRGSSDSELGQLGGISYGDMLTHDDLIAAATKAFSTQTFMQGKQETFDNAPIEFQRMVMKNVITGEGTDGFQSDYLSYWMSNSDSGWSLYTNLLEATMASGVYKPEELKDFMISPSLLKGGKYSELDQAAMSMKGLLSSLDSAQEINALPTIAAGFDVLFNTMKIADIKELDENASLISNSISEIYSNKLLTDKDREEFEAGLLSQVKTLTWDNELFKDITEEEFNNLSWQELFPLLGQLDPETEAFKIAKMVVQGLINGLDDEGAAKMAMNLGFTTLDALRTAFQIKSPSRATMQMGMYLVQGLQEGLNNTKLDTSTFTGNLLAALSQSIGEGAIKLQDLWSNAVENATGDINWDELTDAQKFEYETTYGKDYTKDQVKTGLTIADIKAKHQGKYEIVQTENGKGYNIYDKRNKENTDPLNEVAFTTEEAAAKAMLAMDEVEATAKKFFGGDYITSTGWNSVQLKYMSQMLKNITGDMSVEEYIENNGLEKFYDALNTEYAKYKEGLENSISMGWAEIEDQWRSSLKTCQELDDKAAEEVYKKWKTVWEGIAALRVAAFEESEKTVAEILSKDARDELISRAYNQKKTELTFASLVKDMFKSAKDLEDTDAYLTLPSYLNSGLITSSAYMGFRPNSYGFVEETPELGDFKTYYGEDLLRSLKYLETTSDVLATAKEYGEIYGLSRDDKGDLLTDQEFLTAYAKMLGLEDGSKLSDEQKMTANTMRQVAEALSASGALKQVNGEWKINKSDGSNFTGSAEEMKDLILAGMDDTKYQALIDKNMPVIMSNQIDYLASTATQYASDQDARLKALQAQQDLIARKRNGEFLTSKEEAEVSALIQKYGSLDAASEGLATEMDNCAGAVARFIQALANGYVPTGSNGQMVKMSDIRQGDRDEDNPYATREAAEKAAGKDLNIFVSDGQGGYTYKVVDYDKDSQKYYLRTDVVSADKVIDIATATGVIPGTTTNWEQNGNEYWTAEMSRQAQAAGFANEQAQRDYINAMIAAGGARDTTPDEYSDGGMLSVDEMQTAYATKGFVLTDEEALNKQREYANQLSLMEQGLKELNDSGKDWLKTLKAENKSMTEKSKILPNLRKSYQKLLGLTEELANSDAMTDFFLNPDNLELAQKAATKAGKEGQKALDELQAKAAAALTPFNDLTEKVEGTNQTMAELGTQISQIQLDAGAAFTGKNYDAVDNYWNHVLNTTLAATNDLQTSVDTANGIMNTLGADVTPAFTVESADVDLEGFRTLYQPLGPSTTFTVAHPDGTTETVQGENFEAFAEKNPAGSFKVSYLKGKNGQGLNTKNLHGSNLYTKNPERPGGGGGGGGGGGSPRRRYLSKAKPADHKERYHEIDNAIDDVVDALERLNKQQDRAWGAERLKSMQAESEELKKQRDLIRKKTEEAQDYLKQDLADAAQYGWTFDEDNNVSNYEENWNKLLDVYNAKIAEYNAMSAEQQEALEKDVTEANENGKTEYINPDTGVAFGSYEKYLKYHYLDEPTAALEQVEETMEELEQLGIDYDDVLNSLYDNFIDQVQTKWDTANEIADANIEYLEHKISRLEDNAYKAAETIGLMSDKMDYTQDKFNAATTALDDLLKGYDSAWSAEAIMAGQLTAEDLAGAGMDANAVEMVQSIMSELMNLEQEMTDTLIESFESMTEAFDEFNEDLDRYISTIEHAQSITSTYRNIIDLTGKSMSGFSAELLKAFNNATIDQAKANMKSNKTKYDTVQAEYNEAYEQYLNAQTLHTQGKLNDAALQAAKEAFEATQDNLNEAQEAYVASWEAALQAVADSYTSTMEGVMDEVSKNLANGLAGGIDALQERMDRMKTKDSNYVDDYEKIYQLTKLTRDLETQIDNTSNVRAQKELLKFQKEINGILQSDKKLSEYDIDYLQKKYDLKLAEIALEDAQNAKSQVTMRRDSEGNYNYVYTADENAVADAEAEYATKLYEMQKANDEYITSLSDSIVSLEAEMKDALLALDPTQFANKEEFNAAVKEIIAFYTEQMSYHQEQLETVLGNNKDLYEKDMVWYNKYANYKMADAASFIDSWNETLLAQATGFETIDELFGTFFSQAETAQSESVTAYRNYIDAINTINAEAGHPTETLAQSLTEDIQTMTDQAEQAATDMEEHAETIVGEITSIGSAIEEMANKFGVEIVNMAKQTDLLVAALTDMLEIMGKAGDIELEEGLLADIEARRQAREQEYASQSFDTGGYTGSWGPEGKLAWLHQKELILNATDTENILASVGILRQIANTIDLNALTSAGGFISLMSSGISGNKETLQQEVHIEASFPAVTDKNQIEDAFTDLVNLAAQYANRK